MRSRLPLGVATAFILLASIAALADPPRNPSATLPDELLAAHSLWVPGDHGEDSWYIDAHRIRTDAGSNAQAVMINDTGFIAAYLAEPSSRLIADTIEGHFTGVPLTPSNTPSIDEQGHLIANLYAFYKVDNTGTHGEIIGVARCNAELGLQVGQDMVICQSGDSAEVENGLSVGFTRTGLPVQIENNGYRVLGPTSDGWLAISSKGIEDRRTAHLVLLAAEGYSWSEQHDFGPITVPGALIQEAAPAIAVDVDSDSPSGYSDLFLVRRTSDGRAFYASPEHVAAILSGSACAQQWQPLSDSCLNASIQLVSLKGIGGILPLQDEAWLLSESRSALLSRSRWTIKSDLGEASSVDLGIIDHQHPPTLIRTLKGGFVFSSGAAYDIAAKEWNSTVPTWWAAKSQALFGSAP